MGYIKKAEPKHYCHPPEPLGANDDWESEFDESGDLTPPKLKPGVRLPSVGDIWECDNCGKWWKLHKPPVGPNWVSCIPEWREKWRPWWKR